MIFLFSVGGGAPVIVTGYRGERFDIRCTYESGYESNPKYLCKGACNIGNKVIVVKSGSPAEDQRFSLSDNTTARVFTVTITDLRLEDEGQYWCGVERSLSADVYSEILLLVKMDLVPVTGGLGSVLWFGLCIWNIPLLKKRQKKSRDSFIQQNVRTTRVRVIKSSCSRFRNTC
ncbi:hypothetical protein cypCar_00041964 [Cyprinus carpio]|nr:hypothetical protein cypCar_00041964 [Cyprinus carpio]